MIADNCPICKDPFNKSNYNEEEKEYHIYCDEIQYGGAPHCSYFYRNNCFLSVKLEISQKFAIIISDNKTIIKIYSTHNFPIRNYEFDHIIDFQKLTNTLYLEKILLLE